MIHEIKNKFRSHVELIFYHRFCFFNVFLMCKSRGHVTVEHLFISIMCQGLIPGNERICFTPYGSSADPAL